MRVNLGRVTEPSHRSPASDALSSWLEPGETATWVGRPDAAVLGRIRPRLVLFGLFWTVVAGAGFYGFAATWFSDEYAGIALGLRVAMMALAAAPFVGVAVWTLWAHAPLAAVRARSTVYAVTDRRVLVVRPFPWPWSSGRSRSLPLDRAEFALDTHDVTGPGIEVRDRRQVEPSLEFVALADAAVRVEELRTAAGAPHGDAAH